LRGNPVVYTGEERVIPPIGPDVNEGFVNLSYRASDGDSGRAYLDAYERAITNEPIPIDSVSPVSRELVVRHLRMLIVDWGRRRRRDHYTRLRIPGICSVISNIVQYPSLGDRILPLDKFSDSITVNFDGEEGERRDEGQKTHAGRPEG
jgi:hypothetical protein